MKTKDDGFADLPRMYGCAKEERRRGERERGTYHEEW